MVVLILTAHQPCYLPWLGLFHKIALADQFISFNQVQYQAKEWNNRNKIKTSQGPAWLSVPVFRKGRLKQSYKDVKINNNINWGRKHWNSLLLNYSKTPYFKHYADYFEDTYSRDWDRLIDLNETMLQWFINTLGINIKVQSAEDYNFTGKKNDLVLDMCLKMGAKTYIFGGEGENYANVSAFNDAHIKVLFDTYDHPIYPQINGEFISHLSIVDLLFNCGSNSFEILMNR